MEKAVGRDRPQSVDEPEEDKGAEEGISPDRRPTVETPASGGPLSLDRSRTVETPVAHPKRLEIQASAQGDASKWWYYVLCGLLLAGFAVYEYVDLTKFEQEGPEGVPPSWMRPVYDLVGKWGVVGVLGAIGLLLLAVGVYRAFERE